MKSTFVIPMFVALLGIFTQPTYAGKDVSTPNVLIILVDDLGYADVGFQGCKDIPTPNMDRLAKSGVICTNGYVTHPFCSPTRAGLLTGRYQQRFGHEFNPVYDPLDKNEGLPLGERLLPQFMKEAGYKTAWVGKWHLGSSPAHIPSQRGFDETFGFIGGGHRYLDWIPNERQYTLPILKNEKAVDVKNHVTTVLGEQAAAFVQSQVDKPWFLYLAFNAPHTPHEPTAQKLEQFASIQNVQRRKLAAQISLLDDAVGVVLDSLQSSKQSESTLVFFLSDNGGPTQSGAINTPLRGAKGTVYEGGIRVPFVVSWPGKIPAATRYELPVISLDIFATALGVAGKAIPTDKVYDGVNLIPHLKGENKESPHQQLFWRHGAGQNHAMREANWKIVRAKNKPAELYDLGNDIAESRDLANEKPEVAKRMNAALDAWDMELKAPVFLGSSVKNEDWGPGGANQKNNPKASKKGASKKQ
jgi:arylsulfatase A-like enzyme